LFGIEGAFNRTSFDTIKQAAERHGNGPKIYYAEKQEHNCYTVGRNLECFPREVCFCHCCGVWSWMIFFRGSTVMDIIQ
jgi:hypothetical protein